MSYAIFELGIHEPPASAARRGGGWYVVCEGCNKRSQLTRLLSDALALHNVHVEGHVDDEAIALERLLSSTRNPCVVHRMATHQWTTGCADRGYSPTAESTRKDARSIENPAAGDVMDGAEI